MTYEAMKRAAWTSGPITTRGSNGAAVPSAAASRKVKSVTRLHAAGHGRERAARRGYVDITGGTVRISQGFPEGRKMNCRNLLIGPTLLLAGMIGAANSANAWAFYWSKVEVQTSSWKSCMNIAYGVAQKHHLGQVKRNNLEVSGTGNGASATITCVGTGGNSKAMAIVMVVGDADGPVRQLRDDLAGAVNRERILDSNQ